jgi:hypothetical protein
VEGQGFGQSHAVRYVGHGQRSPSRKARFRTFSSHSSMGLYRKGVEVPGRLNHEKTHSTWRDRWSRIIECDTFLSSNVAKKCRALSRHR